MPHCSSFDDARLWFDVRGGNDDPILLIAGNACDHTSWCGVDDEMAERHPVIVYDHRGTGGSDARFTDGWSTRDFARDAAAVIRAAGFDRAHVYGHSMGGRVAQWLAVDEPDAVVSLTLGATSAGGEHAIPRPAEATRAMLGQDHAAMQRMCFTDEWIVQHAGSALPGAPNPTDPGSFAAHLAASAGHDAWDALPSVEVPTLIVHGSDDRITPPGNARILHDRIRSSRLLIIDGARHVYWAGFPQVNEVILDFMTEAATR